ncbi:prolyl oligopeptidase family serine peptidase [uncultured Flavobacterium sp.]|uniref:S9 family peptidase n=1 Tax=uncultured Flavobacterium sp. TaxID=165435 RepID=UPI00260131C8|nr:prolyl oligopeptidase family serine peptidase [uncultured Flavobacterium sp.]
MKTYFSKYLKVVYGPMAVIIFGLVACPLSGQVLTKKDLAEDDYHLWHTLVSESLSADGNWISHYVKYETGKDTLFVRSTRRDLHYAFPGAVKGRFFQEDYFICNNSDSSMSLLNLKDGKTIRIPNTTSAQLSADGEVLVTIENKADGYDLVLRSRNGSVQKTISGVKDYIWNNRKDAIAYSRYDGSSGNVNILLVQDKKTHLVATAKLAFSGLTWSANDSSIAFYGESVSGNSEENTLFHYIVHTGELNRITSLQRGFPVGMVVFPDNFRPLRISKDDGRIFFGLRNAIKRSHVVPGGEVEIWNGNAKKLYPIQHYLDTFGYANELGVWFPKRGVIQITNRDDYIMLAGNENYALVGNTDNYPPQYTSHAIMDFNLLKLDSGESIKFLEGQSGGTAQLRTSPDGMYILYYRDANWWSYSIAKKKHTNITLGTKLHWDKSDVDGTTFDAYGIGGWTDANEVIIYDRFDLWLVSMDGQRKSALTHNRERMEQARIVPPDRWKSNLNYTGSFIPQVDLSTGILLQIYNFKDCSYGYATYSKRQGLSPVYSNGTSITNILKTSDSDVVAYVEQKYDVPPKIVVAKKGAAPKTIFQSNHHHTNFNWGESKVVTYCNSKGDELKGALFYPPHYDRHKKYPMVVYIYETLSSKVNEYVNPTFMNPHGFNISNLLAKGYLILLPDILYETGNTGQSATDCVTSAVKAVIRSENVDPSRIGLLGHSFGGFETNYIVTQTDIFAAAVSGSAVSDAVSGYLSIRPNTDEIDIWRYEDFIYRMGGSLYDCKDQYLNNSPVLHAAKITTPLLLFAGKQDDNVDPEQSLELYIALRRLQKPVIMLMYPSEGHAMASTANAMDLTKRVENWFDFFLKGDKAGQWICDGID